MEYQVVSAEIRDRTGVHTSIVGLGLSAVGGGFLYAVSQRSTELLLLLPLGYFGLLLFALFNATGIALAAGYRRYIEGLLNEALGEQLFQWERVSRRLRPFGFSTIALLAFCATLLLILVCVALAVLLTRGIWQFILGVFAAVALFTVLSVGAVRFRDAFHAALEEAERGHLRT